MPSNRIKDSVDIYRFKITTKGATKMYRGGEWQYDDDREEVEFVGFYASKYRYEPWVPSRGTLKVEHQKLMAEEDFGLDWPAVDKPDLKWVTIETKSYKDGERDD